MLLVPIAPMRFSQPGYLEFYLVTPSPSYIGKVGNDHGKSNVLPLLRGIQLNYTRFRDQSNALSTTYADRVGG